MKRKEKIPLREWQVYVLLGIFSVICCWMFCGKTGILGAKVDWISQHSVIPDYFRQQFYQTGELFPEYAANIGAGQNIYYFSYYGLFSPIILLSYALPFVKMSDYIMVIQVLSVVGTVCLLYRWFRSKLQMRRIAVAGSILFLLAGPLIMQSFFQIMFVDYMPFLCMAFFGVDHFFEKEQKRPRKKVLLILSVWLMILTSFYFSIGGICVITVYAIYCFFAKAEAEKEKIIWSEFFQAGLSYAGCLMLSVLMSAILLIPTAFALLERKSQKGIGPGLQALFLPGVRISTFCYDAYGIGLTTLTITALIAMAMWRKRAERWLAIVCGIFLTVPFFSYMLNGGLYIRSKVMIPFLPLLCYVTVRYLESVEQKKTRRWESLSYVITIGIAILSLREGRNHYHAMIILDSICMLVGYWVSRKRNNTVYLWLPSIVILLISGNIYAQMNQRELNAQFYEKVTDEQIRSKVAEVLEKEDGFYRMEQTGNVEERAANLNRIWNMKQYVTSLYSSSYNGIYQKFRSDTFQLEEPYRNILMQPASENPIFQRFMGIRYLISDHPVIGYQKKQTSEAKGQQIYENTEVSPVIYGTDQMMEKSDYEKLDFPYNQLALLNYAVVDDKAAEPDPKIRDEMEEQAEKIEVKGLPLEDGGMKVENKKDKKWKLELGDKREEDGVLFVQFELENQRPSKDVSVWLNGVRNKLSQRHHIYYNKNTTFSYGIMLGAKEQEVELTLGKGKYKIRNFKSFFGKMPKQKTQLYQSEFKMDLEQTRGNQITGEINMKRDGMLVTTIPYDENFSIYVDGQQWEQQKVNTAFLGIALEKGTHEIRFIYNAPGVMAGKACGAIGILVFVPLAWMERKKAGLDILKKSAYHSIEENV